MRSPTHLALRCAMLVVAVVTAGTGSLAADDAQAAETGANVSSFESPAGSSPLATLRFRPRGGLVMLPVSVNGSEPLSFLLDTGYSITTVHPALVDSLKLNRAGRVTIVGIAGEEDAPTYSGAQFRLGDVTYAPRRVAAVPSEAQRRRRRDGIIGSGLFRRYVVQIDFAAATVRLFDPASYSPPPAGEIVPLRFRQDTPSIAAVIPLADGKSVTGRFEVDTGCDDGLCIGRSFVVEHRLDEALAAGDGGAKQGVGGEARIRSASVASLQLGRVEARKVSASFFEEGSPAGDGMAGHIGMDALRQFVATFDYSRQRLILEAVSPQDGHATPSNAR